MSTMRVGRNTAKGVLYQETLRRQWRIAIILGFSMVAIAYRSFAVISNAETLRQFSDLLGTMPSFMMDMLGGADAAFMATPSGFLTVAYFSWAHLLLVGYAVYAGLSVSAAEEDQGILDMLLSAPLPRTQLVIEKLLAYSTVLLVVAMAGLAGLLAGARGSEVFAELSAVRLLEGSLNALPVSLLTLMLTAFLGATLRRRSSAMGAAIAFVVASYFLDVVGRSLGAQDVLARLSFFSYYDSIAVAKSGLVMANVLLLLAISLALAVGTVIAFNRRDIGL
jgi:ABC-type transport system involved in multi-copper enzyme maturation permease subunit